MIGSDSCSRPVSFRSRDRRVLILPVVGTIVGAVGNCTLLKYDVHFINNPYDEDIDQKYVKWVVVQLGMDLFLSWYATLMIIGKLWWAGTRVSAMIRDAREPSKYRAIIIAFIESGTILSVTMAAYIGFWASGNVSGVRSLSVFRCLRLPPLVRNRRHHVLRDHTNCWDRPHPHCACKSTCLPDGRDFPSPCFFLATYLGIPATSRHSPQW